MVTPARLASPAQMSVFVDLRRAAVRPQPRSRARVVLRMLLGETQSDSSYDR